MGAASVAATVMLLVRRRAPEGSRFADGDRAAGIFGVIATGFSVAILGCGYAMFVGAAIWVATSPVSVSV